MAINLIVGAPGSGKSYEAVANHVLPALRKGRKVITNLPLNVPRILAAMPGLEPELLDIRTPVSSVPIRFASMVDYSDPWRSEDGGTGPLYVIDEAHQCLPKGKTDPAVLNWFALHRHETADVVIMTQQAKQLHTSVTGLIQWQYILRKNTIAGSSKTYRMFTKDGMTGDSMPPIIRKYDKAIFPFYQSYTLGGGAESVKVGKPLWMRWPFIGLALIALLLGYMLIFGGATLNPATALGAKAPADGAPATPEGGLGPGGSRQTKRDSLPPGTLDDPATPAHPGAATAAAGAPSASASILDGFVAGQGQTVTEVARLRPSDVLDAQWTRLGNRCSVRLRLRSGAYTDLWQWSAEGWEVALTPVVAAERERMGSCHLRVSLGPYAHEWAREPSWVYVPKPGETLPPTMAVASAAPSSSSAPGVPADAGAPVLSPDRPLPPATAETLFPGAASGPVALPPPPDSEAVKVDGVALPNPVPGEK